MPHASLAPLFPDTFSQPPPAGGEKQALRLTPRGANNLNICLNLALREEQQQRVPSDMFVWCLFYVTKARRTPFRRV